MAWSFSVRATLPMRPVPTRPERTAAAPGSSARWPSSCAASAKPHVYTAYWDGVPGELPADHVHGPLFPDLDDGIVQFTEALRRHVAPGARLGVDEQTHPMVRALDHYEWTDASSVLGAAKIIKTPDEVSAIRAAQRLTKVAMESAARRTAPRPTPDGPQRHLPPPALRAGRHRQRHRSHLAGHGADQGGGPVDDPR